jgi:tetratricopeptide (TPR) repeat protein
MTNTVCPKRLRSAQTQVAMGLLLGALWTPFAWADDYTDVNRLLKAGQPADAMARADQFLAAKPRDPQMRFLKGVILAETGKANEAIALFVKLTEEFPELPEPYNNLAVLYAGQSQFDKARVALEMAIRTNPSYATAHENLGDVYAKLASQAYSKALQLDGSNAGVPPKLALIRNLFAPDARLVKPAAQPAPAPVVPTPVAAPKPTPITTAAPLPTAQQNSQAPSSAPADTKTDGGPEALAAVQAWAKAWANKDMAAYLGAYGTKFVPPGSQSRAAWEAERTERIVSKKSIAVNLSDIDVKAADGKAIVSFRQDYKAGNLVTNTRKTLEMVRQNGRWLIARESSRN